MKDQFYSHLYKVDLFYLSFIKQKKVITNEVMGDSAHDLYVTQSSKKKEERNTTEKYVIALSLKTPNASFQEVMPHTNVIISFKMHLL